MTLKKDKRKKKKVVRGKYRTKAEAEARVKRLRAEGREARIEYRNGYYFVYELLFLAVTLGIFSALLRRNE